jgi:hypothetical protein
MRLAATLVLGMFQAAGVAGPSAAQQPPATFTWTCNIGGAPAQLTAQVQAVTASGLVTDPSGFVGGVIPTGEVNYFYQGTLVSATARYAFTGTNNFADFVDLIAGERFPVRLNVQGLLLQLVINPFGPGPVQYLCQVAPR